MKILAIFLFSVIPVFASINVTLTPSLSSPQLVGTPIVWAAGADNGSAAFDFQFSVASAGQPMQVMQDYDVSNTFPWTPSFREGRFLVQVVARNMKTLSTATLTEPFTITSRVTVKGVMPVITPSANPLVALFSSPGCPAGSSVQVKFSTGSTVSRTSPLACSATASTNQYVAGMLPLTTYSMNYEVLTGNRVLSGPVQQFTTGAIDPALTFPPITIPLTGFTDTQQQVLLINAIFFSPSLNYFPFATDLSGNVIWYYPTLAMQGPDAPYNMRPVPGGTIMLLMNDPNKPALAQQLFREIDLAGNSIRQTSVERVSAQLAAMGKLGISSFTHDVIRLANGHTVLLAYQEMLFPPGTQGATGTVDILGDAIIDLDENLQVAWSWSAYDFLNINRPAVLGEVCIQGHTFGCPPLYLAPIANDWIHANSINYLTADGSLILSSRHQDWVFKIDYNNGTGSGSVLWTLGLGGNFSINGIPDPYQWFSHQHDVEFQSGGNTLLTLYDNGNTRIFENPGEDSRGQALVIDQTALTATLTENADMGVFSIAVGAAQLLDNGNYNFDSGWISTSPDTAVAQSVEVTPAGTIIYELSDPTIDYRTYRMSTLYSIP